MVTTISADKADFVTLTTGSVILQGHLQSRVNGGGTTHGEENVGEALARKEIKNLLRKLERKLVRGVEAGGEVELGSLILDGFNDLLLTVTGVHTPQTRHTIQDRGAILQVVMNALGGVKDFLRILFETLVVGERHPELVVDLRAHSSRRLNNAGIGCTCNALVDNGTSSG